MARLFDDASSEYLLHGSALITAYPLTLAGWFYTDDATIDQSILAIQRNDSGNHFWNLGAHGGTAGDPVVFEARSSSSSPAKASTSTGYSTNTWHHACGVGVSATDRTAYIDGGSPGTNATSRTPGGIDDVSIGMQRDSTPSDAMSGRIAEVALWDVALSAAEVAALASGVTPLHMRPGNLVAYWPVWGLHSPEIDLTSNGNNITVTGPVKAGHAPVTLYTPKWAATVPLIEAAPAATRRVFVVG